MTPGIMDGKKLDITNADKLPDLPDYQKRRYLNFIAAYLTNGCNSTEAYMVAYPEVSRESAGSAGSRLLKDVRLLPLLNAELERLRFSEQLTPGTVQFKLWELLQSAKSETNKTRIWELIGKSVGMFSDQTAVQVNMFQGIEPPKTITPIETSTNSDNGA